MQAGRSKAVLRSTISNTLAMLLCFVSAVAAISFLFDGNFRVRASSYKQNGVEKLSPPAANLPRLDSLGAMPVKSEFSPREDGMYPMVTHAFNFVGKGAIGIFMAGDGDPAN